MGCTPSSQNFQVNDNESRLLQEIDRLRSIEQSRQAEISKLRAENDKLRQVQLNGGYESMDSVDRDSPEDDSHEVLVKEIERLKLEQGEKEKEISVLRKTNEQLNITLQQSPPQAQVHNVQHCTVKSLCNNCHRAMEILVKIITGRRGV